MATSSRHRASTALIAATALVAATAPTACIPATRRVPSRATAMAPAPPRTAQRRPVRRRPRPVVSPRSPRSPRPPRLVALDRPSTVEVDAMWVRLGPPAEGGLNPVALTTGPGRDGHVRVGLYEEVADGIGPLWRAGVWLAAFVAASSLDHELTDFTFSAETGGSVDGASASGLMAAGYLAAMTGAAIDPGATMSGIINPDGTIGPVGGLSVKFRAALAAGKRILGYPVGLRHVIDPDSGATVDLVELAHSHGARAIAVPDVYAAYQLLTGRELWRPEPVGFDEMKLDGGAARPQAERYRWWAELVDRELETLAALERVGRLPGAVRPLAQIGRATAAAAGRLHARGAVVAATTRLVEAWIVVAAVSSTADVLERVAADDLRGARARLDELQAMADRVAGGLQVVRDRQPTSVADYVAEVAASEDAMVGWVAHQQVGDALVRARGALDALDAMGAGRRDGSEVAERVAAATVPAALVMARAVAGLAVAREWLDAPPDLHARTCRPDGLDRSRRSLAAAAAVDVSYLERLIGVENDAARDRLAEREPDYRIAQVALAGRAAAEVLDGPFPDAREPAEPGQLASLAAAQLAYRKASILIGRHYSLRVRRDREWGRPSGVELDDAFRSMLTLAERTARTHASAARAATGSIPAPARRAYQGAIGLLDGDVADRLEALERLWQSSAYSQTAVMLARACR